MAYNCPWRFAGGAERPQVLDFIHIYKVLATSILETVGPTRCAICDMPGNVLCDDCARKLPFIDQSLACPRCGAPFGRSQCTECPLPGSEEALARPEGAFPFTGARSALSFEDGARRMIRTYKDGDELRLDRPIASLLCAAIRGRSPDSRTVPRFAGHATSAVADWSRWADALTFVPASPEAVLRRGFDHMERVSGIVSQRTGLPLARLLSGNRGVRDQRELGRSDRLANRRESFSPTGDEGVTAGTPRNVVLLDDVFTTGATLSSASRVLLESGVREVRVVTCCRVW